MRNEAGHGGVGYLGGVRAGLPFALVTETVAIAFRVLARSLGWGVLAPIVFSVITFSASAQFAVAAVPNRHRTRTQLPSCRGAASRDAIVAQDT